MRKLKETMNGSHGGEAFGQAKANALDARNGRAAAAG
jgi:hypothetical protein